MVEPIQRDDVSEPGELVRSTRGDAGRALVLGLNAWALLTILPFFVGGPREVTALLWALVPLPFLAVGAALVPWHRQIAAWLLLGAFPTSVAGVVAAMENLTQHSPYGTVGLSIGALGLVAFGAAAAHAVTRPVRVRTATWRPLGTVSPLEEPKVRRWGRRLLVGVTGAGALALALIAPKAGDTAFFVAAWGDAADEAATLSAVVGGALGASLLALIVGPGLRASRRRGVTRRRSRRRVATLLGLAVLALALYVFYALER